MTQYQGQLGIIDLDDPKISITEVIHALSHINRYNGYTDVPWSVAAHLILCDMLATRLQVEQSLRLPILTHDFEEAYLGEIVHPIKVKLNSDWYSKRVAAIEAAIAKRFGFEPSLFSHPTVKFVDRMALYVESKVLFKHRVGELWTTRDKDYDGNEIAQTAVADLRNSIDLSPIQTRAALTDLIRFEMLR